jgi:hypothetical protein
LPPDRALLGLGTVRAAENSVHHIERREVTEYGKSLNTLAAPLGHGVLPS